MARYLTTTLPYVNADPHIGFAVELLQADTLVRLLRLDGQETFFNTGTDEHGQKIYEAAQKAGKTVEEYVDHYAAEFRKLAEALSLDNPTFIRTTDAHHIEAAQEMWRRCAANGDIYKQTYKGLYCVGDEMFIKESDLVDGHCPNHPNLELEELEEENYFFALSKYEDRIRKYLTETRNIVVPEWRKEEALNFVNQGLEDFSISRDSSRLSWGVPVPDDPSQVMYVWFDALTSYISTLGWPEDKEGNFKKYWEQGETLQLAGKDQVRFQSIMWQAMLMSANVKNTDQVFYHGFITSGGKKMSKSLGNVISPYELVSKYGTEATRYLLLRHVHAVEDSDITWERLDEWYTANLVNGLGNLVARVMKLSESYVSENEISPKMLEGATEGIFVMIFGPDRNAFRFDDAMDTIWALIQHIDQRITKEEPFKVVKEDTERGAQIIKELVQDLILAALFLQPFMPATSAAILAAVKENKKPENLFPRLG